MTAMTVDRPVTSPDVERNVLTRAELAAELGVLPDTITLWLRLSKPGQRYAEQPFPDPDDKVGASNVWYASRLPNLRAWMAARPRDGIGGRPRKS